MAENSNSPKGRTPIKCPFCKQPMEFCSQIGEYCGNDACPVEDDALLWYRDRNGNWKRQKWIQTMIEPGHYRLTLSPKEV